MSGPVVDAFEAGAVLGAAEEGVEGGVLELDEQAASSSAAPAAVIPNATRSARGLGLLWVLPSSLKRFMRPRIYHTGFDRTTPGVRVDLATRIVNSLSGKIAS